MEKREKRQQDREAWGSFSDYVTSVSDESLEKLTKFYLRRSLAHVDADRGIGYVDHDLLNLRLGICMDEEERREFKARLAEYDKLSVWQKLMVKAPHKLRWEYQERWGYLAAERRVA